MTIGGVGALVLGCGGLVDQAMDAAVEGATRKGTEWALEYATGSDIEFTDEGIKVTNADGSLTLMTHPGELPDGYPHAVMPGTEILGSAIVDDAEAVRAASHVLTRTSGTRAEADAWYLTELESKGFDVTRVELQQDATEGVLMVGRRADAMATVVITEETDGQTLVALMAGPPDHAALAGAAEALPEAAPH